MVHGWFARLLIAFLAMGAIPVFAGGAVKEDPRWKEAINLQNAGEYGMAADAFAVLLAEYPDSQETALRVARNQERAGLIPEAISGYDVSNGVDPLGYWAEVGLYYQAILKYQEGDSSGGEFNVEELKKRFPDSRWTARGVALAAQQAVKKSESGKTDERGARSAGKSTGNPAAEAEATLALEMRAYEAFKLANNSSVADNARIAAIDRVIKDHGDTRAALQALDTKGHLLIRGKNRGEAIATFQEVINRTKENAPQSRVAQTALTRMAALKHVENRKADALADYDELAKTGTDPALVSNAKLQGAGLFFELRQDEQREGKKVSAEQWAAVRTRCAEVITHEKAKAEAVSSKGQSRSASSDSSEEAVIAELMTLESYLWENSPKECLRLAEEFISSKDVKSYRRQLGTAHNFAAESLIQMKRFDEALTHLQWIVNENETGGNMWPVDSFMAQVYYRVADVLNRTGAPEAEVLAAGDEVLSRFPNSEGAALILASRQPAEEPGGNHVDPVTEFFGDVLVGGSR